jgi:hypothetical protein
MKKFIVLLILLFATNAYAQVDTCTYKRGGIVNGIRQHIWVIHDDASETAGTCNCATEGATSDPLWGWIVGFKVVPTTTAPPDSSYDVELRDSVNAFDFFFGEGNLLDGTSVTSSANVDVPVTDAGAYPFLFGEQVYIHAHDMGSTDNDLTVYVYIKE